MTQPTSPLSPQEERLQAQEDRYIQEAKTVQERLARSKAVAEARRERAKRASPLDMTNQPEAEPDQTIRDATRQTDKLKDITGRLRHQTDQLRALSEVLKQQVEEVEHPPANQALPKDDFQK